MAFYYSSEYSEAGGAVHGLIRPLVRRLAFSIARVHFSLMQGMLIDYRKLVNTAVTSERRRLLASFLRFYVPGA